VAVPEGSDFPLENLPYGVADDGHVVVAIGDHALDLAALAAVDAYDGDGDGPDVPGDVWTSGSLNAFMGLGPDAWAATRRRITGVLTGAPEPAALRPRHGLRLRLPFEVADYVDFYASQHHAANMGRILRPDSPSLPPAWRHLPIGYHGRSASIVVSGEAIPRPRGLVPGDDGVPRRIPTRRLDVEVEVGFVVGVGSTRGTTIATGAAHDHVFGAVLVNDWSARDVQAFEYVPLGPFLGKSFATSISPWVVPLAALAPYWVAGPVQDPEPARYLASPEPRSLDLHLELALNGQVVSRTNARELYWSMHQQLAHCTANGAPSRTGDLFASGAVSGADPGSFGSLMELTWGGRRPLTLPDGTTRTFLADGDTATISGWCGGGGRPRVGFGSVAGTITPAPVYERTSTPETGVEVRSYPPDQTGGE
jgi:fumarylacetoacetase